MAGSSGGDRLGLDAEDAAPLVGRKQARPSDFDGFDLLPFDRLVESRRAHAGQLGDVCRLHVEAIRKPLSDDLDARHDGLL